MNQTASCSTLVDTVAVRGSAHARTIRIAAVLFITALTAAAAQFSIPVPFTVVPFTLQPMVVLLGGLALGARLGLASQFLYLMAGIAGLPVFAASATLPPVPPMIELAADNSPIVTSSLTVPSESC